MSQQQNTGQKQQDFTVNEKELGIIKTTFSDNEILLKKIRARMLGLNVSEKDKQDIARVFSDKELYTVIKKRFYPTFDMDTPIGQIQDVWLGVEQMIFGATENTVRQAIDYKEEALVLTAKGLESLVNVDMEGVDVSFTNNKDDKLGVNLLARNQYVRHVESQLMFLMVIAGKKEETEDQAKKRLGMDSAK